MTSDDIRAWASQFDVSEREYALIHALADLAERVETLEKRASEHIHYLGRLGGDPWHSDPPGRRDDDE